MTRLEALKELAAKVEAGTAVGHYAPAFDAFAHLDSVDCARLCYRADQKGSLDAALALHEAVLPGMDWEIDSAISATVFYWQGCEPETHTAKANTPARAWLLAILRALIAQEEADDA